MTDSVLKLTAWLSPGYPVGAYSYSHGLEWAVEEGRVHDATTAQGWIADCLAHGAGRSDAILMAHAWKASGDASELAELSDLGCALAPSAERLVEMRDQGAAFGETTAAAWGDVATQSAPYPVAVGAAAGRAGIALELTLGLFLQAWVSNLVSAAIRLVPLGQVAGQKIVANLQPEVLSLATEAAEAPLDAIGGCAILSDIASMRHETQTTRLFRS